MIAGIPGSTESCIILWRSADAVFDSLGYRSLGPMKRDTLCVHLSACGRTNKCADRLGCDHLMEIRVRLAFGRQ